MACLDNETATAYLRGDLEAEEADRWAAHLAECESCRRLVQEVSALMDNVRRDLMLAYSDPVAVDWRQADRVVQHGARSSARRLRSLRPHFVGASLATAVTLVLFIVWWRETPVTAAEALRRAGVAEHATANNVSEIVHRTLAVEERRQQGIVRRQRVEIWQNAASRTKVRRLYDESGQLLAGEWTRGDGSRAVYRPTSPPAIEQANAYVPLDSENVWRWEPSVQSFNNNSPGELSLERRSDAAYVLRASGESASTSKGIRATELTIAATDFRPIAQAFRLESTGEGIEFVLTERAFEALAPTRVEPALFVPERELLRAEDRALATNATPKAVPVPTSPPSQRVDPYRGDRLAMRAWYRLHGLGFTIGRDAFVERTAAGLVRLDLTVSSELRRLAVSQRLAALAADKMLVLEIRVASDSSTAAPPADWSENPTYIQIRDGVLASLPLRPDASSTADIIARETVIWILKESEQIQNVIQALSRFSAEWAPDRLRDLELDALAEWQTIVRDHATDAGQRAEAVRDRCMRVLGSWNQTLPAVSVGQLNGVNDAVRLVERLAELSSRQRSLLSDAMPTMPTTETTAAAKLDESQLMETLTEIAAIATKFAGPWPLGR